MDFNVPNIGSMPTDTNSKTYEADMLKYKEASGKRQMAIQMMMEDLTQQQATRTNMMKSSHDALMAVIQNFKS